MIDFKYIPTEDILDSFPENLSLYKDSGLWTIRDDDDNVLEYQGIHETLRDFLISYAKKIMREDEEVRISLSTRHR
jgi:hypothetical protein